METLNLLKVSSVSTKHFVQGSGIFNFFFTFLGELFKSEAELLKLSYSKHGNGEKHLFLFHGFGQDSTVFAPHLEALGTHFTCYMVDLFYHGQSDWPVEKVTHKMIRDTVDPILVEENIRNFSMLGFSLGGRICISLLSIYGERCDQLFLLATDGIYRSPWYRFATAPLFNPLFKYLMWHPKRFDQLLALFDKSGLVPKTLIKFSRKELSTPLSRKRVFYTWTHYKPLQVAPMVFHGLLQSANATCHLYLGTKDSIVQPKNIIPVISPGDHILIRYVESKHNHIIQSAIPQIISELSSG